MNWKWIIAILILIGWGGTALYASVQRAAAREAQIEVLNIEAEADTARLLHLAELGDSVTAYQRLVTQTEIERDSLDAALDSRPVIRLPGELRVDTLEVVDTVEIAAEIDQTFEWDGHDPPFSIQGSVALMGEPTPSAIVTARVVQVDPVNVEVRVSCSGKTFPDAAVDAVSVVLLAEDPFSLNDRRTVADPDVCNPRTPFVPSIWPELSFKGIGYDLLKVGVGVVIGKWLLSDSDSYDHHYDPTY